MGPESWKLKYLSTNMSTSLLPRHSRTNFAATLIPLSKKFATPVVYRSFHQMLGDLCCPERFESSILRGIADQAKQLTRYPSTEHSTFNRNMPYALILHKVSLIFFVMQSLLHNRFSRQDGNL